MPRLGVLGWPVAHSLSPAIHNAALAAMEMEGWSYQLLPVPPELLVEVVHGLAGVGFVGANVTIPHKQAVLALADRASDSARAIGAANTLVLAGQEIVADNTDAPGLLAALGFAVVGLTVQVLGAGGSARAAVWALAQAGAAEVWVFNRNPARAVELTTELGVGSAVARPRRADVLVNCTSVGLQRSASESETLIQLGLTADLVGEYGHVVDLVYTAGSTPLLALAHARGVDTVDGHEVLLAQGALSLRLWTGRQAPVDAMRAALARADRDRGTGQH